MNADKRRWKSHVLSALLTRRIFARRCGYPEPAASVNSATSVPSDLGFDPVSLRVSVSLWLMLSWLQSGRAMLVFLFALTLAPSTMSAAQLRGQVELTNSKDPGVRRNRDYGGVVIWLEPVGRSAPAPIPRRVEMKQQEKTFKPHVVAVPIGGLVDFPNLDPFFHNAFSNFAGQPFDLPLYAPGTTRSVTFRRPGIVRVFCQIHSLMSAIIAVVDTPWYVVTRETGQFRIDDIPPGEYQLHIFHERALPDNLHFLERAIAIPEGGLTLPLISISETGYIPAPHPDKYGKPYPPQSGYGKGGQ
jgi:plastocyanin